MYRALSFPVLSYLAGPVLDSTVRPNLSRIPRFALLTTSLPACNFCKRCVLLHYMPMSSRQSLWPKEGTEQLLNYRVCKHLQMGKFLVIGSPLFDHARRNIGSASPSDLAGVGNAPPQCSMSSVARAFSRQRQRQRPHNISGDDA